MDTEFEIFEGKSFKGLCKDIYDNHEEKKHQIDTLISDLRPLVKKIEDAMIIVPFIKQYIDSANINDEHLVKLASVIQRIISSKMTDTNSGIGSSLLTEEEKKELWNQVDCIKENNKNILIKKIN